MMFIIPILAYGAMAPFVYCSTLYEPNYDVLKLLTLDGTPTSVALEKMNEHFGAGEAVKWFYLLEAKELGPVDNAALLQVNTAGASPTAEEVAFAQHAMKMSRKANGKVLHEGIVTQPDFGIQVCKFVELMFDILDQNNFKTGPSMVEGIWYGADPFHNGQHGCRSQDQISDGLQKKGVTFDDQFGDYVHRSGTKTLMLFYPGLDAMSPRSQSLYRVLKNTLETQASHEFTVNGKRYWFQAKHTSIITYEKETADKYKEACPIIWAVTITLAFAGIGIVFRSIFLPLKFCMTVLLPMIAIWGFLVAIFQENWFKFMGCNSLAQDGGLAYNLPFLAIALLFGLAMDYDIFVFARVYEYRHAGYDNTSSVQKALVQTGPTIMTAGVFMCLTFLFSGLGNNSCFVQMCVMYFSGVALDCFVSCTCITPAVLCWGEWLNFFPGYIPPVSKKYNVDEGCDEVSE
jgi:hypothetical protein